MGTTKTLVPQLHPLTERDVTTVTVDRAVAETSVTRVSKSQSVRAHVRQLMKQIDGAPRLTDEKAQAELAKIVRIFPDLVLKDDPDLTDLAGLAVTGLVEGEPSIAFARSIRRDIEGQVSRWKMPFRSMYRGRPPMRATLGLLLFLTGGAVAMTLLAIVASSGWRLGIPGIDGGLLAVAAAMGGLGSIISVFVRVPRMSEDFRNADPEVPFFVGLLKPMVGMAFAVFAFAAVEGGFLPLTIDAGRTGAFYIAISFVAGFSERFVPDIIGKAEGRLVDGTPPSDDLRPARHERHGPMSGTGIPTPTVNGDHSPS